MPRISPYWAMGLATLLVAVALVTALVSEWWGLVPCALCLLGRWPYRVAIGFGLLGLAVPARLKALCGWGLVACMVASVGIGVVHVGVEAGWWPSPLPGCVAQFTPGGALPERPAKPCDEPTYLVPGLPVSMAMMSLVFSAAVAGGLAWALAGGRRAAR